MTAVVAYFDSIADFYSSGPLIIDPRPIRERGSEAQYILPEHFVDTRADVVEFRRGFIRAAGFSETDAIDDYQCVFTTPHLLPELARLEPDTVRARRARCAARPPYNSIVVGLPFRADVPSGSGEIWRVRAHHMSTSMHYVYDLDLSRGQQGAWVLEAVRKVTGAIA